MFPIAGAQLSGVGIKAVLIGIVITAVFFSGWTVKGWKDEVAYTALQNDQLTKEKKRADDALAAQQAALQERDKKQGEINVLEGKYHDDVAKAKREIDCLRSGKCGVRLRIPTVCTSGATGSGDTAVGFTEAGADLTPTARQAYFDLRQALIEDEAKTEALQNIALTCSKYQR